MIRKEFMFRGKTLEELKKLSLKEIAELFPARQRRSITRGFTEQEKIFLKSIEKNKSVKTHCRDMIVLPNMVGKIIKVHKGNEFVLLTIEPEMIGHYLGEFVLTRKRVEHHAPGIGATKSSGGVGVK